MRRFREMGDTVYCQSRHHRDDSHGLRWVKHDLVNDSWEKLSLPNIDVVIHLAGQTSVYKSRDDPKADLSANVISLLNILEFFRSQVYQPFVILAGTVTVVGIAEKLPINESTPELPVTFYDLSKLTSENYLKLYVKEGIIRGCCLRLPNVFGRREDNRATDRGILDQVYRRAIAGQNVNIYGDGSAIRDYLYIDDAVSAFISAIQNKDRINGRTFCIGSGKGITLRDAFLTVISAASVVTGKKVDLIKVTTPTALSAIEFRDAIIDATEFIKATGWMPRHSFDEAIKMAYSWD